MTTEEFDEVAKRLISTLDEEQILDLLTIVAYLTSLALAEE